MYSGGEILTVLKAERRNGWIHPPAVAAAVSLVSHHVEAPTREVVRAF
jgi:hypothetical protein